MKTTLTLVVFLAMALTFKTTLKKSLFGTNQDSPLSPFIEVIKDDKANWPFELNAHSRDKNTDPTGDWIISGNKNDNDICCTFGTCGITCPFGKKSCFENSEDNSAQLAALINGFDQCIVITSDKCTKSTALEISEDNSTQLAALVYGIGDCTVIIQDKCTKSTALEISEDNSVQLSALINGIGDCTVILGDKCTKSTALEISEDNSAQLAALVDGIGDCTVIIQDKCTKSTALEISEDNSVQLSALINGSDQYIGASLACCCCTQRNDNFWKKKLNFAMQFDLHHERKFKQRSNTLKGVGLEFNYI